jgi:hypothetical protein
LVKQPQMAVRFADPFDGMQLEFQLRSYRLKQGLFAGRVGEGQP